VSVRIDKTGRRNQPARIDLDVRAGLIEHADLGDPAVAHPDFPPIARGFGAIDDGRVANDKIEMLLLSHGRPHSGCAAEFSQSIFAPDFLTTSPHLTVSFFTKPANCSGVPPTGSASIEA
jgi:hypothetical protein